MREEYEEGGPGLNAIHAQNRIYNEAHTYHSGYNLASSDGASLNGAVEHWLNRIVPLAV